MLYDVAIERDDDLYCAHATYISAGYYGGTPYEVYNSDGNTTPVHPVMGTSGGGGPFIPRPDAPKYTFEEMKTATDNFKVQTGEGVIGPVYQGTLPDGKLVAVITLPPKSGITADEFISEVSMSATSCCGIHK